MSVRVIGQVLETSAHAGSERLMLVVLADYSDDDGNSYPSVASLARKCLMSCRNANYILSALQASGELRVLKNEGPKGTNRYRIMLDQLGKQPLQPAAPLKPIARLKQVAPPDPEAGRTPEATCTLKPASATPEAGFPKPLKPASDEPSLNRQEPKKTRERLSPHVTAAALLPDVDRQVLADWEKVRKAKRVGPVTGTVVKLLRAEAGKAGKTVQQALETCCVRGWASFNAEWRDAGSLPSGRGGSTVLHADHVFEGAQ